MSQPDFCLPQFFVYIIESNSNDEFRQGYSEGEALSNVLKFSGFQPFYEPCLTKGEFAALLNQVGEVALQTGAMPILHISAHGSDQGVALTSGQFVHWREMATMLTPLHAIRRGIYLLCLSSCKGLTSINVTCGNAQLPVFGFVGTLQDVSWNDNVIAFAAFYHLLGKGETLSRAVEGMKAASGHYGYRFVHGPSFVQALFNPPTLTGAPALSTVR